MRLMAWLAGTTLALTGCATTRHEVKPQAAASAGSQISSLTYATTPCHGFYQVYSVTIGADGAGVFIGTRNTAVVGERRFTATAAQVASLFGRLQPYLQVGEVLLSGPDTCKVYATDLPCVDVTWTGEGGAGHLLYDYGCEREARRPLAEALRTAPPDAADRRPDRQALTGTMPTAPLPFSFVQLRPETMVDESISMRTETFLTITVLIALVALGACTTTGESAPTPILTCNPKGAAALVGQVAPNDAAILRSTHSSTIRRVAPGNAMTKDYRVERVSLTVAEGRIVSASCG